MRHFVRTTLITLVATALATAFAASAQADNTGEQTGNGYAAKVQVHLSGDVSQSLVGSVPGPPPMCWWENLSSTMLDSDKVDTSDPAAVEKYIDTRIRPYLIGSAGVGTLSIPDTAYFKSILAKVKAGADMTFYSLQTRKDALGSKPGTDGYSSEVAAISKACGTSSAMGPYGPVLMSLQAFPTGQEPPPAVSPDDLAAYAYEVMDLKKPTLEWNPHLASDGDASLVNLPTWLWTKDPAAVEQRQVTAEAAGISVTVTAEPSGMTVSTPVGGTDCSAEQARTAYAPGVDDGSACVFTFPRSSSAYAGGFPVQATTGWQATWTSNSGPGGTLDPKTMNAVTNIPVIEVQSRVDSVS